MTPSHTIGELADTSLGKMLDSKRAQGEPTPYLRNINVRWGFIDLSDLKSVPLTTHERTELRVRPGDLLVCEGGEPGRCAVFTGGRVDLAYQKALHRVRVRDTNRLDVNFLALMLETVIRTGQANSLFTGTTIKHLPQVRLRTIRIPVPSLDHQRRILRDLQVVFDAGETLGGEIVRVEKRSANLRRALLASAFSGRLAGHASDVDQVEEIAATLPADPAPVVVKERELV